MLSSGESKRKLIQDGLYSAIQRGDIVAVKSFLMAGARYNPDIYPIEKVIEKAILELITHPIYREETYLELDLGAKSASGENTLTSIYLSGFSNQTIIGSGSFGIVFQCEYIEGSFAASTSEEEQRLEDEFKKLCTEITDTQGKKHFWFSIKCPRADLVEWNEVEDKPTSKPKSRGAKTTPTDQVTTFYNQDFSRADAIYQQTINTTNTSYVRTRGVFIRSENSEKKLPVLIGPLEAYQKRADGNPECANLKDFLAIASQGAGANFSEHMTSSKAAALANSFREDLDVILLQFIAYAHNAIRQFHDQAKHIHGDIFSRNFFVGLIEWLNGTPLNFHAKLGDTGFAEAIPDTGYIQNLSQSDEQPILTMNWERLRLAAASGTADFFAFRMMLLELIVNLLNQTIDPNTPPLVIEDVLGNIGRGHEESPLPSTIAASLLEDNDAREADRKALQRYVASFQSLLKTDLLISAQGRATAHKFLTWFSSYITTPATYPLQINVNGELTQVPGSSEIQQALSKEHDDFDATIIAAFEQALLDKLLSYENTIGEYPENLEKRQQAFNVLTVALQRLMNIKGAVNSPFYKYCEEIIKKEISLKVAIEKIIPPEAFDYLVFIDKTLSQYNTYIEKIPSLTYSLSDKRADIQHIESLLREHLSLLRDLSSKINSPLLVSAIERRETQLNSLSELSKSIISNIVSKPSSTNEATVAENASNQLAEEVRVGPSRSGSKLDLHAQSEPIGISKQKHHEVTPQADPANTLAIQLNPILEKKFEEIIKATKQFTSLKIWDRLSLLPRPVQASLAKARNAKTPEQIKKSLGEIKELHAQVAHTKQQYLDLTQQLGLIDKTQSTRSVKKQLNKHFKQSNRKQFNRAINLWKFAKKNTDKSMKRIERFSAVISAIEAMERELQQKLADSKELILAHRQLENFATKKRLFNDTTLHKKQQEQVLEIIKKLAEKAYNERNENGQLTPSSLQRRLVLLDQLLDDSTSILKLNHNRADKHTNEPMRILLKIKEETEKLLPQGYIIADKTTSPNIHPAAKEYTEHELEEVQKKQFSIITEFYQTEKEFIKAMQLIKSEFCEEDGRLKPTAEIMIDGKSLTEEQRLLFEYFLQPYVQLASSTLATELPASSRPGNIDEALQEIQALFQDERYKSSLWRGIEEYSTFNKFINEIGSTNFRARNKSTRDETGRIIFHDIIDHAIKVVQRPPRHALLLGELQKNTSGEQYFIVCELYQQTKKTNDEINLNTSILPASTFMLTERYSETIQKTNLHDIEQASGIINQRVSDITNDGETKTFIDNVKNITQQARASSTNATVEDLSQLQQTKLALQHIANQPTIHKMSQVISEADTRPQSAAYKSPVIRQLRDTLGSVVPHIKEEAVVDVSDRQILRIPTSYANESTEVEQAGFMIEADKSLENLSREELVKGLNNCLDRIEFLLASMQKTLDEIQAHQKAAENAKKTQFLNSHAHAAEQVVEHENHKDTIAPPSNTSKLKP